VIDPEHEPQAIEATGRRRLANRRTCESFDFELRGHRYHATIGRFDDGRPAEIFINGSKPNSTADITARDCAVAISIGLQYGVPLEQGAPVSPAAYVLDALLAEEGKAG
jgi:hypothetical protein